ncbi:MAG: fumarate hydratase [Candidatus Omnitrophica bacterium]|jgi:fumarate hydratase subunit alpha|nr:fumarate hydratase [Candidatus Omnitrophota bacterium]
MRVIQANKIKEVVSNLCKDANFVLRSDVLLSLRQACAKETNKKARNILKAILDNARIAKKEKLAICQDTGLPTVFIELGQDLRVQGDLMLALQKGVEEGYRKASLRNSIVRDPLARGKSGYSPAVVHVDLVKGSKIKITLMPKGFGCENKTQLKMFKPTVSVEEIKKFIVEVVRNAGPDACPPYVVGVGIGGTADYACLLAKKALLIKLKAYSLKLTAINKLERELLFEINKLNIGPMGLGGKTTVLAVNILTHATHIAGLPVCVNISCHALRSATEEI